MNTRQILETEQKALEINLDEHIYGEQQVQSPRV